MSHLVHKALQESLFGLLSNDVSLTSLVTGIYDRAPKNQSYPYVVLEAITSRDWSTRTTLGFNTEIPILVYTQTGSQSLMDILDRIYVLLRERKFNIVRASADCITLRRI